MTQRIALALAFLPICSARADDWPQWLGPQRDGVWREAGIIEKFPEGGPPVLWRHKIGAGYSGPAVADGRVYVMDRQLAAGAKNHDESMMPRRAPQPIAGTERVLCFDASGGQQSGKLLWTHEYDCPYGVSYPAGPRATPVVADGRVYTLGTEGHLHCLNATDGKVVWSRDFKKDYGAKTPVWGHSAHPLLDGDKLICMVGGDGTTVVAFHKDTGKELWRALSAKGPGYCPPMIYPAGGTRQLVVWHAEAVCGLEPQTGKQLWSVDAPTYQQMSIATPRLENDRLFVTAYPNTSLMLKLASDRPAAEVEWKGEVKKNTGFFTVFSTPHFEDGHVYGVSSGGVLTCLKADTGGRLWQTTQPHGPKPEGSAEMFLVKNGDRWFVANEHGDLIIARLSPKGYEEISRAHLLKPTGTGFGRPVLWSHPAFANRCAYMRNDEELICVSLAAN